MYIGLFCKRRKNRRLKIHQIECLAPRPDTRNGISWVQKLLLSRTSRPLNSTASSPKGISERNRRRLASLYRSVNGPFTVREAAGALTLGITPTQRFLAYLADRGWLVRIQRGLYGPVSLDAAEPSQLREDPWIVAVKLFGPSCYMGGWPACEHWGLTDQIFRETVVITTRRLRSKAAEIQGFPFLVKRTGEDKTFGTRPVWRAQTRVYVSDPSRTVADILDDPSLGGGIRHVTDVLGVYFNSEHRDDALLADYIGRIGNHTSFKRLGYLLETLSIQAPALFEACKVGVSAGISRLDPGMPARGRIVSRWNLRVNATIAAEAAAS